MQRPTCANRRRLSSRLTGLCAPHAKCGASSTAAARPSLFPHLTSWAPLVRNPPPEFISSQSVSYPSHSFLGPETAAFVLTDTDCLIAHTPHIHIANLHIHTFAWPYTTALRPHAVNTPPHTAPKVLVLLAHTTFICDTPWLTSASHILPSTPDWRRRRNILKQCNTLRCTALRRETSTSVRLQVAQWFWSRRPVKSSSPEAHRHVPATASLVAQSLHRFPHWPLPWPSCMLSRTGALL